MEDEKKAKMHMASALYLLAMIVFVVVWMVLPRMGEKALLFEGIRSAVLFALGVAWLVAFIIKTRKTEVGWVGKISGYLFLLAVLFWGVLMLKDVVADLGTDPVTITLHNTNIGYESGGRRSISTTDRLTGECGGEDYRFQIHRGDLTDSERKKIKEEHPAIELCYYVNSRAIVSIEILEGAVSETESATDWMISPNISLAETSGEAEGNSASGAEESFEEVDFSVTGVEGVAVGDSWQSAITQFSEKGYFGDPTFSLNYYSDFTTAKELFGIEEGQYCVVMTNGEYRVVLIYNMETELVERIQTYQITAE